MPPVFAEDWLSVKFGNGSVIQRRWPLHTQPRYSDTLQWYVRRLANDYGVRYEHFCYKALGIPLKDSEARTFRHPSSEVLKHLSEGTGISVSQLQQMTPELVWKQLVEEAEQFLATPEGKEVFDRMTNS